MKASRSENRQVHFCNTRIAKNELRPVLQHARPVLSPSGNGLTDQNGAQANHEKPQKIHRSCLMENVRSVERHGCIFPVVPFEQYGLPETPEKAAQRTDEGNLSSVPVISRPFRQSSASVTLH